MSNHFHITKLLKDILVENKWENIYFTERCHLAKLSSVCVFVFSRKGVFWRQTKLPCAALFVSFSSRTGPWQPIWIYSPVPGRTMTFCNHFFGFWWTMFLVNNVFGDQCFWWTMFLVNNVFGEQWFWWPMLLVISFSHYLIAPKVIEINLVYIWMKFQIWQWGPIENVKLCFPPAVRIKLLLTVKPLNFQNILLQWKCPRILLRKIKQSLTKFDILEVQTLKKLYPWKVPISTYTPNVKIFYPTKSMAHHTIHRNTIRILNILEGSTRSSQDIGHLPKFERHRPDKNLVSLPYQRYVFMQWKSSHSSKSISKMFINNDNDDDDELGEIPNWDFVRWDLFLPMCWWWRWCWRWLWWWCRHLRSDLWPPLSLAGSNLQQAPVSALPTDIQCHRHHHHHHHHCHWHSIIIIISDGKWGATLRRHFTRLTRSRYEVFSSRPTNHHGGH